MDGMGYHGLTSMIPPIIQGIYERAAEYPVPRFVEYSKNAVARTRTMLQSGLAMFKRALSAGVKPKPTTIRGICCEVLLGSSLKNMWNLRTE